MQKLDQEMNDAWEALAVAQEQLSRASERAERAFRPRLLRLELLPQLFEWYEAVAREKHFAADRSNHNHKQFVFVALLLYAPRALYGGTIQSPLRRQIAALLQLRSHTMLYHLRDKAVAWNGAYKAFAREVEEAYNQLERRIWERERIE